MTLGRLLTLALQASMLLTVFALGVESEPQDAIYLLRHPARLWRSLLSINIIMPACAVTLALAFHLNSAVKVALVTLAISPVPATLPKKQLKAGGQPSYAIGLLVIEAVLAIVFIPAVIEVLGTIFRIDLHMRISAVAMIVLATVLVPLVFGMVVARFAPNLGRRIAGPVARVAPVVLAVCMAAILFTAASDIASLIGNGTIVAIAAFSALGVAAGHLLGGPDPEGRAVLALASATRHPGVAIAIASANFAERKMVLAAILLFLIVGGIVTGSYARWIKTRTGKAAAAPV